MVTDSDKEVPALALSLSSSHLRLHLQVQKYVLLTWMLSYIVHFNICVQKLIYVVWCACFINKGFSINLFIGLSPSLHAFLIIHHFIFQLSWLLFPYFSFSGLIDLTIWKYVVSTHIHTTSSMWYDFHAPAAYNELFKYCSTVGYFSCMMDELIGSSAKASCFVQAYCTSFVFVGTGQP